MEDNWVKTIHLIPNGVTIFDKATLAVKFINSEMKNLLGIQTDEDLAENVQARIK